MARRWSTGFELQSVTNGMEWDTTVGSPTINTTIKRSGNASLRCNPTNSNAYLSYRYDSLFNTKDVYIRFYLYIATSTNALDIICMIREATFSTNICSIRLNSNRTLELWDDFNAVQIGSDSSALNIEQWYRVELFYDESDGSLNARINGTSFASGTGSLEQFNNQIQVGCISSTIADLYFDDIAINNNSGSDQNSWPGEGSIIHGYPNAAGDNNDCSAGDYTSIDDNPTPDDSSTKAVLDNDNDILDVNCENSSTIGLTSFDTITLVQVGVREAEVSAAQASWKLRIKSASGGTVTEGSITTHNDTTYRTNGDALPRLYTLTSYTDPTTSLAWTPTGTNSIDNMQIGIQAVDATPDTNVSTLWALIEYIPAGITTSTTTSVSTSTSTSTSSTTTSSSTTQSTSTSTSTSSTTTSSSTSTTQSTSSSTSTSSTTTSSSTTITTSSSTSTSSTTTSSSTSTTQSTSTSTSSTTTSSSTSSTTTSTSSTTTSSSTTITTSTSTSSSTSTTTTLFFELSFNVNDVEETDNTTLVTDENKIEVGYFNSVIHDAGLRFQNITIPAGSDILSAVLTIDVSLYETTSQSYIQLVIKGDDSGNSIVWASDDRPSQREKTTASVNWDIASPDEDSPDIATVIEEIIRRGDWESGNALSLIIEERNNVNGNRIQFVTAEGDPTYGSQPVLAVQWSSNNLGTTTTSTTSTSTTISTSTSTTQSTSTSSTTTSSSTSTTQSTSTSTSSTTTSSSTSTSTSTSSTTTSSSTSTTTSSSTSTTQSTSTSTSSTTTSSSTSTSISTSSTTTSSSTSTTTSSSTSTTQSTSTSSTTTSSSTSTTQSTSTSSTTTSSSTSTTQSTSTSSTTTSSSTSTTTSSSTSTTQSTSTSSTTTSSSTSTTQSTSTSSTTISSSTSTTQSTSTSSTTTSSSTSTTISTSTSSTTTSSSTSTTQSTSTSSTTTSSSTSTTQSTSTSSTTTSSSTSFTTSSSTSTTQSISTSSTTTSSSTSITQSTSTSTTQSVTTSTSSTTTSSSTSTTISTSTTTTLNSLSGGLSFGEENPNQGESAISWQTWSDGSGGIPTIVGNQDWGKIDIDLSEEGRSQVYDFSNIELRLIILTENRYESGQGIATLQYRTSDSIFNQDDINPSWNNYSDQFLTVFRYMQIRIIKEL